MPNSTAIPPQAPRATRTEPVSGARPKNPVGVDLIRNKDELQKQLIGFLASHPGQPVAGLPQGDEILIGPMNVHFRLKANGEVGDPILGGMKEAIITESGEVFSRNRAVMPGSSWSWTSHGKFEQVEPGAAPPTFRPATRQPIGVSSLSDFTSVA